MENFEDKIKEFNEALQQFSEVACNIGYNSKAIQSLEKLQANFIENFNPAKEKKTNFDVLTESPEKMAEELIDHTLYENNNPPCAMCVGCHNAKKNCEKGVLAWLKMEVVGE